MLEQLDRVTPDSLSCLNRNTVRNAEDIRALLERLRRDRTRLAGGINRRNEPRTATVTAIDGGCVVLALHNFDPSSTPQAYFNFEVDGERYFFAASRRDEVAGRQMTIDLPSALFRVERRDLFRTDCTGAANAPRHVGLRLAHGRELAARVLDWSSYGLGVEVEADPALGEAEILEVAFQDGPSQGEVASARLCHATPRGAAPGHVRVGLALRAEPHAEPIGIRRHERILERAALARMRDRVALWQAAVGAARTRLLRRARLQDSSAPEVHVVEYPNDKGQPIRAVVDTYGDPHGAPAVVIPPAWGRTKETLLPLASTLLETFRRAGKPVRIVRFDGTHRRGESHIDPEVAVPGREYLRFTFSQAVRDIQATLAWLHESDCPPSTSVLVTFSLAAVEGRRAVASDTAGRIGGWVSVVGMVDLQSALRTISGGVDFAYGLSRGVRFGHHELVGVVSDMDHTGLDAIRNKMVFLEEARQDMSRISVPTTWIHGRHDAWMDLGRVQEAMSCGATGNRRLIEVPTGHQLRTSTEALETFQLVAEEVSEMALGRRLTGTLPRLRELDQRRDAERARLPKRRHDLRSFWTDYLLGRDRSAGMELMTATAAYKNFMEDQIRLMRIAPGETVADLGCGTGDFAVSIASRPEPPAGLQLDQVDYVPGALERSLERLTRLGVADRVRVRSIVADLNVVPGSRTGLDSDRYDAVLSSLVISYLSDPAAFLAEVFRVLKPGGRLVLSSLKRDADISKIFVEGMSELAPDPLAHELGSAVSQRFDSLARSFFNDASRILDLEEDGTFRFFSEAELNELVWNAGFSPSATRTGFGDPPQAVIVSAVKL